MIRVITSGSFYDLEHVGEKWYVRNTNSLAAKFILNQECTGPVVGERLIIMSTDPNNQLISRSIRGFYEL